MNTKKNSFPKQALILLIGILSIISCQNSKDILKNNTLPKDGLIEGAEVSDKETYQSIRSNIARLQALLTGKFVQQAIRKNLLELTEVKNITGITEITDSTNSMGLTEFTQGSYFTCLVNDKNDSLILYSIPVGDPNRIGYWIYHYQILTSLPDDPVYEVFEKLTTIDRDSIKGTYYLAPDNFNLSLDELIKNHKNSFESIDIKKLKPKTGEGSLYIRKNPLFFKEESPLVKNDPSNNIYQKTIYEVSPGHIYYHTITYEGTNLKGITQIQATKFTKLGLFK